MRKNIQYIAMAFALVFAAACNKVDDQVSSENAILFAPRSVETKALVNDETDLQSQTLQVYDYMGTTEYINNTIVYNATDGWVYGTDAYYKWEDGTHKFFGYTSGAGIFASNALSVSKTLTTSDADQVDLLYSDIFTTTAADWKTSKTVNTPVSLDFHHLLSAVSFMVKNASTNQVVLKELDVKIPNNGSATVSYTGDAVDVQYGEVTEDGDFITAAAIPEAGISVAGDALVDVLTRAAVTDTLYQVVWPQEIAADALTVRVKYSMTVPGETTSMDYTKDLKIPATTWEAGKKYKYILNIYPTETNLEFVVQDWQTGQAGNIDTEDGSINMSNVTWMNAKLYVDDRLENTVVDAAYSVYMYHNPTLSVEHFYEDDVYLTYEEDVYDEDGETILHHAGDNVLDEFNNPIFLHRKGEAYYTQGTAYSGYYPAQGYFTVNYPKEGLFKMELIPAKFETSVDASKYQIMIYDSSSETFKAINANGETITNNTVYFQVRAAASQYSQQYKAQLNILFKPDGSDEWISAFSEIRANYALVIPAVSSQSGD